MRYPTNMNIAGIDVPVHVQASPVYTLYKCPVCKDADTKEALVVYLREHEDIACPCCDTTQLQNTQLFIWGKYDILNCDIAISAPNEQVGGMNLVHETIEGINSLCDLGIDHTAISTLGTMLYKAFASGCVDFTPKANVPGTNRVQ